MDAGEWVAIGSCGAGLLLALIGLAYKYGVLSGKVKNNCEDIMEIKKTQNSIFSKLNSIAEAVVRIDTTLNGKSRRKSKREA